MTNLPSTDGPFDVHVDIRGKMVSMQTIQHIYNDITGKTEELSKAYSLSHCASYDDIKQLNVKITQLYEQYNIQAQNCAVTLYHVDDQKQVFSSFERFEFYDRTTLSPVENIHLEYKFLIILPQVQQPQSYEIDINIQSRAALVARAKSEDSFRSSFLLEFMEERTAHLEIKYIDYTVARNFQVAIDSWFKGLPCCSLPLGIKTLKRFSDHFSILFKLTLVPWLLFSCIQHFAPLLDAPNTSTSQLYQAATVTFGAAFLLSILAGRLGSVLGNAIRRIRPVSYLKLTRGDDAVIKELSESNQKALIKGILSLLFAIVSKLIASAIIIWTGL